MCDYNLVTISGSMITIKLQDLFLVGDVGAPAADAVAARLLNRGGHVPEALMVDYLYSAPAEARNKALSFEGREGA